MNWSILLCGLGLVAFSALAQDTPPDAQNPPATPAPAEGAAAAPETPSATPTATPPTSQPKGDVIHLKGGGTLEGVQVVERRVDAYVIQVVEGVPPIEIPRDQVDRIDYDDLDLAGLRSRNTQQGDAESEGDMIPGQPVAAGFFEKITKALPGDTPLTYENQDLIDIVNDLSKRFDVKIEVGDGVKALPKEARVCSLTSKPDTSLVKILRNNLLSKFPNLDMTYKYDHILISLRDATKTGETPAPATPTPPAEAPDVTPSPTPPTAGTPPPTAAPATPAAPAPAAPPAQTRPPIER